MGSDNNQDLPFKIIATLFSLNKSQQVVSIKYNSFEETVVQIFPQIAKGFSDLHSKKLKLLIQ